VSTETLPAQLTKILRCPETGLDLKINDNELVTVDGSRRYPIFEGIPCLLPHCAAPTHSGYRKILEENRKTAELNDAQLDNFIGAMVVATCGNLFRGASLNGSYPIPNFPEFTPAGPLLDLGCNWGRWTIAGAYRRHLMIGVDIHLKALLAARRLSRKLVPNNEPLFVLADARQLPFASDSIGGVFSYSVVQHFSVIHARQILREVKRVLKPRARSLIQMPNRSGLRAMLTLLSRVNREASEFDVRYYSVGELIQMFGQTIGDSGWFADCYFGLNVHSSDKKFVAWHKRWIISVSECLLQLGRVVPSVARFADSVFVSSIKA
jgi:ubiquinone/menaquinone biosynthesis C-methylase UbiE/uncharacterized protein YbaR (Trm112 family)